MSDTFLFRLSIVNAGRYGLTGLIWAASSYACLVLAAICMHKETGLLCKTRGANFAHVFLSAADTSGVTTRKAACRPALRPDVKAQPRW